MSFVKREPLVVALDDLHWSDAPSLELLGQLMFVIADAAPRQRLPVMIVAAQRPVPPGHRLNKLAQRLRREPIVGTLALEGLAEDETRALLPGLGLAPARLVLASATALSAFCELSSLACWPRASAA